MKNNFQRKFFLNSFFIVLIATFFLSVEKNSAQAINEKIKQIEALSEWNRILVNWEKNEYLSETENLILIRKKDVCPENIFDGEEIYRGNGFLFEDKMVQDGEKYCYGVGISNLSGNYSDFKTSTLVEKLNFKEKLFSMLTNEINIIIFSEIIILVFFLVFSRFKRNFNKILTE